MKRIIYLDELSHYGVKGMKWGVRKDRSSSGKSGNILRTAFKITHPLTYIAGKKINSYRKSDTHKARINKVHNLMGSRKSNALKKYRNQDINKMSDQELQSAINRMNLERNYRSLTRIDFMKGQKQVSNAVKYDTTYKAVKKTAAYVAGKKIVRRAAIGH